MSSSSRLPSQIQYRNGTYFGGWQNYYRQGYGLLILDNSNIVLAQWNKGNVHGKYAYITDSLKAYGTMIGGRLDGYNILWNRDGQGKGQKTIYGMFREDKLYGKAVVVQNRSVLVGHFSNNQLRQVISKTPLRDRELYQALTQHYPNHMYTLQEFLLSLIQQANAMPQDELPRYQPVIINSGDDRFFGYEECFNRGRRFGFVLRENRMVSIGQHQGMALEGIGRFYAQECTEDGIFKDGYLRGVGIKYYRQGNRYTIGQHDGRSQLEKGFGFPIRQISQIRKEFHLRSIYFYNDIIMLGFSVHLLQLMNALALEGRPRRESPKFNHQQPSRGPPLRQNLFKYEQEEDYISDSSPIKDKFSEYKPIDRRSNQYFTLDEQEEEMDRRRSRDHRTASPHIRSHQNASRFNQPTPQQGRDRSNSRTNPRVRDTKEFVRELQEEQKKKRLDLDKIYRQAGLYRKR